MVLNLRYGNVSADDSEAKEKIYEMIRVFSKEFIKINSSIICRDLLGYDLKQEGAKNMPEKMVYLK